MSWYLSPECPVAVGSTRRGPVTLTEQQRESVRAFMDGVLRAMEKDAMTASRLLDHRNPPEGIEIELLDFNVTCDLENKNKAKVFYGWANVKATWDYRIRGKVQSFYYKELRVSVTNSGKVNWDCQARTRDIYDLYVKHRDGVVQ